MQRKSLYALLLILFVSACTSNRTPYTFNKWEKIGEKEAVIFEAKRLPQKESGSLLGTNYVGTFEVLYRARNKSGSDRCVKFTLTIKQHLSFAGDFKTYTLVEAGVVVNVGTVVPSRNEDSSWTVQYNAAQVSKDTKNPCKNPS